jgi:peptide/nickel transport system substrate-binding protein
MAVLIQEQFRRAGIDMKIEQMDWSAFQTRQSETETEAAFASWHLPSSTESIKGAWTTNGEQNYSRYSNKKFDVLVDSALAAPDVAASRDYFGRANQIIVNDAPAIWLYEPRTVIAINKRIKPTPMRPSAWWLDIASWKVAPPQ